MRTFLHKKILTFRKKKRNIFSLLKIGRFMLWLVKKRKVYYVGKYELPALESRQLFNRKNAREARTHGQTAVCLETCKTVFHGVLFGCRPRPVSSRRLTGQILGTRMYRNQSVIFSYFHTISMFHFYFYLRRSFSFTASQKSKHRALKITTIAEVSRKIERVIFV